MNLADLFTVTTLTAAVNKLPLVPSQAGALNIFTTKGIPTTSVVIESRNGRLFLVSNSSRSDDSVAVSTDKRQRRVFETTHLVVSDQVLPSDIQNINPFLSEINGGGADAQAQVINDRLQRLKNAIEATREWQRVGALGGKILDADGSVIYDLFKEFGVEKKTAKVVFSKPETNVRKAVMAAKRYSEQKIGGAIVDGFKAFCGADFFDALVDHPSVQKAYANYQEASDRLGGDVRSGFVYGGVEWIEYSGQIDGKPFIAGDIARLFPVGTGIYELYNAPANYNETVNTLGLDFYSKAEERKMQKGWDLEVQSNPLALCLYPEALVELQMG